MPCYFPLHAYRGRSDDSGKTGITFRRSSSWRGVELDLPCGQCVGCRLERSRQWAVRCMHEASLYERNCFLTLTYDDEHLPRGSLSCSRCVKPHVIGGSVCVAEFQDFMKRLRKQFGAGIRFYHCGEYGELNGRPHYHAIIFNHDFSDKLYFSGKAELSVYTSKALSSLWTAGFAVTGQVTFESAAYVSRYVMKKVTGERADAHYGGRKPEYVTMSRRPGIGKGWYDKYKSDVYPRNGVVVRGRVTRPPRFYDNLLGREDPSSLALMKIDREKSSCHFVEDVINGRVVRVSDSDSFRLRVKEEVKRAEISHLKRTI